MADGLDSKSFAACLNTTFRVEGSADALTIELVDVTEKHDSPRLEQFSLLFRGPLAPILPKAIHRLENADLGKLDVFLVAVGPEDGGQVYQAVFNRFRESAK